MAINKQILNTIKKSIAKINLSDLDEKCTNEAQTRFTIIEPILEVLGYSRIDDMVTEVSAGFGEKNDRADIGLFVQNKKSSLKPEIIVECKKFDKKLTDKEASQLNNYFINSPSAKIAVLTNGIIWRLYSADGSSKESTLHPTPFVEFSLEEIDDDTIQSMAKIHRNAIDIKELLEEATEFYFMNRFGEAFIKELIEPSDDFIKAIYTKMGGVRISDNIKSKIKGLINSTNLRIASDKLTIEESKNGGHMIITTADELKIYHAIKTLLIQKKEIKSDRITYRDQKNSFLILVDDNQKKMICRLIFSHNKSKIEINFNEYDVVDLDSIVALKKELTDTAMQYFS
jgi:hypothetical protein